MKEQIGCESPPIVSGDDIELPLPTTTDHTLNDTHDPRLGLLTRLSLPLQLQQPDDIGDAQPPETLLQSLNLTLSVDTEGILDEAHRTVSFEDVRMADDDCAQVVESDVAVRGRVVLRELPVGSDPRAGSGRDCWRGDVGEGGCLDERKARRGREREWERERECVRIRAYAMINQISTLFFAYLAVLDELHEKESLGGFDLSVVRCTCYGHGDRLSARVWARQGSVSSKQYSMSCFRRAPRALTASNISAADSHCCSCTWTNPAR